MIDTLTSSLIGISGTVFAAALGVVGLWLVLRSESKERYNDRLNSALSAFILTTADRAKEIGDVEQVYQLAGRSVQEPMEIRLQATVESTLLVSRKKDLRAIKALADCLYQFKRAKHSWQKTHLGEVAGDVRKWRTKEMSQKEFITKLGTLTNEIKTLELDTAKRGR